MRDSPRADASEPPECVNERRRARERMKNGKKRRRLASFRAALRRGNVTPASYRPACGCLHTRKAATIKTHVRGVPELVFLSLGGFPGRRVCRPLKGAGRRQSLSLEDR